MSLDLEMRFRRNRGTAYFIAMMYILLRSLSTRQLDSYLASTTIDCREITLQLQEIF